VRLFDAPVLLNAVRRSEDDMARVGGIDPRGADVAVVETVPGFTAIRRPVEAAAGGREDQVGSGGVDVDGMNVWVDERLRRALEVGIAIAASAKRQLRPPSSERSTPPTSTAA